MRHSQFQNAGDLLHVAGEGGQALFDALFVADVHEELVKHADLTALVGGDQSRTAPWRKSRSTVFSVTVLPPVFNPVMMSESYSGPMLYPPERTF